MLQMTEMILLREWWCGKSIAYVANGIDRMEQPSLQKSIVFNKFCLRFTSLISVPL